MRRFIFSLLIVALLASATFATSKPSLDGRAVVAEEGVLPAGLFAKTVGYLPGDSVSVTNPATGITINVLVLGAIDPSAGVAILLSPEAADKLFITPDSNTQVRITKRTGMLDESVSGAGTVISDTPAGTLLPKQLKDDLDSRLGTVDETLGTTLPLAEIPEEPAAEPVTPEPEVILEPEMKPEENSVELALVPETDNVEKKPVPVGEEPVTSTDEIEKLEDETAIPAHETDKLEEPDYTITSVEEVPMNHVLAENGPVYIVESVDPTNPALVECDEDISPPEATDTASEEIVLVPAEEPFDETPSIEPADPLLASTEDETMLETEDSLLTAAEDPNLVDPFAPIILVPADANPPLEADSTFTPVPVHTALGPVVPAESTVAKAATPTNGLGAKQPHLVKELAQLESGKYYVQIATLAQQENIDKLLAEYGGKYPFVMVPMKSGKAMQMMVGPLNVDEYGAIMAKFKNLGFKDAFLRKIR